MNQLRHEAPELGEAVVRMLRALVTRAADGDTEALEQLARLEELAPLATTLAMRLGHDKAGYSYTQLGGVLGTTRQAARQRVLSTKSWTLDGVVHVLAPGHRKRECHRCQIVPGDRVAGV